MTSYISEPVAFDAATIEQEIRDELTAQIPGLVIAAGTLLDWLIRVLAPFMAEGRQLLTEQLADIFQYLGEKILRVPREPATQAIGTADFTISHTNGYTIPAGTEISVDDGTGTRVAFETRLEAVIPNGSATALGIEILAVEPGAAGTGLSGTALVEQPALNDVASVTLPAPTSGGQDAEDTTAYLNRLADTSRLLAFTLVTSDDFEVDARNQPDIDRALTIPGYKADTATSGVGGHFSVAVEKAGADPGSSVRAALQARQQAMVPPGVVVWVITATYTDIDVVFAALAYEGWDATDVETRAEAAVLAFLDPAAWGLPQTGDEPDWLLKTKVRLTDLITVLEQVEGVDTIVAEGTATTTSGSANLTLVTNTSRWVNGQLVKGAGIPVGTRIISGAGTATMVMSANATASASGVAITGPALTINGNIDDVTLTGVAPLPAPAPTSSATGTVTAP